MGRLKNSLSMRFFVELDLETFALATLEDKENSTSIEMLFGARDRTFPYRAMRREELCGLEWKDRKPPHSLCR